MGRADEAAGRLPHPVRAVAGTGGVRQPGDHVAGNAAATARGQEHVLPQGGIAADQAESVADARGRSGEAAAEGRDEPHPVSLAREAHGSGEVDQGPEFERRAALEPPDIGAFERVAQGGADVDAAGIRHAQERHLVAEGAETAGIAAAMGTRHRAGNAAARAVDDVRRRLLGRSLGRRHGAGTVSNTARQSSGTMVLRRIS